MTSHVGRLYALAAAIVVFFVTWALVAAAPWKAEAAVSTDPRLERLAAREASLREEAVRVQRIVDRRWARYQARLDRRARQVAAARREARRTSRLEAVAPEVQVVNLPPVTRTRSS